MFSGDTSLKTIYAGDFVPAEECSEMFHLCIKLIGGNGTLYDDEHEDSEYARIDTPEEKGYFTRKAVNTIGDVNNDSRIDAIDASLVLTYYAKESANQDGGFDAAQKQAADVNGDGSINAVDASVILSYYAYTSASQENLLSLSQYLLNRKH